VRVEGQLVFNASAPMLDAALTGFGLAYVPEDSVQAHLAAGRLIRVLADWCPAYPGYHLYYPSPVCCCEAMRLLGGSLHPIPKERPAARRASRCVRATRPAASTSS
jgi:DNA-binding transcriptional LysR family regulator